MGADMSLGRGARRPWGRGRAPGPAPRREAGVCPTPVTDQDEDVTAGSRSRHGPSAARRGEPRAALGRSLACPEEREREKPQT